MSLKQLVSGGVNTAFKILAELVETVDIATGTNSYNSTTGEVDDASTIQADVLFLSYKQVDGVVILPGDLQMLVKVADVDVPLKAQMEVTRPSGTKHRIVTLDLDPTNTIYITNVRQSV